jgi:hypothetical protein
MAMQDKTWDIKATLRVTTASGWEPDAGDIETWLDEGGSLLLVSVEECKEAKE